MAEKQIRRVRGRRGPVTYVREVDTHHGLIQLSIPETLAKLMAGRRWRIELSGDDDDDMPFVLVDDGERR